VRDSTGFSARASHRLNRPGLPDGIDIFKPKILISVNLGGTCNGRCGYIFGHLVYVAAIWYILWPFGIFYGHLVYVAAIWYILWPLVYFVAIWYILWPFGLFYGHLVYLAAIWYILRPFGILCAHLVYFIVIRNIFSPFWCVVPRKIWQPFNTLAMYVGKQLPIPFRRMPKNSSGANPTTVSCNGQRCEKFPTKQTALRVF
jgi:hypothetical protein